MCESQCSNPGALQCSYDLPSFRGRELSYADLQEVIKLADIEGAKINFYYDGGVFVIWSISYYGG